MTRVVAVAGIALFSAAAADLPDHVLNLSRVKRKALQALKTLPDYTCLAVTERFQQSLKDRAPRRIDTVRMEVAHSGNQDLYAWPGANRFENAHAGEMIGTGMFGSGEFATHLKTVLDGYAVLTYVGGENTLGRKLLRWDYSIAPFATDWRISFASRTAVAGAKGSLWADAESLDIVRLEIRTDGLPPGFPITEVSTTIDYARVRLGEREVLLAQTALTELTEFSGVRNQNFTEFSHCRQYITQSEIRFGAEPAAGMPVPAGPGTREFVIPANLRLFMELSTVLDSQRASVGDPIEAVVTADATQKRHLIIPKGAVVHGRLRRMDAESGPPQHFLITLEFTDVEYPGFHARFLGRLIQITSALPGLRMLADRRRIFYGGPPVPGAGSFLMDGTSFQLPKGLAMTWLTLNIFKN